MHKNVHSFLIFEPENCRLNGREWLLDKIHTMDGGDYGGIDQ